MSNHKLDLVIEQLTICKGETLRIAGGVAEADRFRQLKEGKAHPAWLVGHLTSSADTIVLGWMLERESSLPKGFRKQFAPDFAGGLPITPKPEDYPAWDEVLGLYDEMMGKVITGIGGLEDGDFPSPLKGNIPDSLRGFFSSVGQTLNIMVLHDSYHRGQIGMLSKLNS
ncbi:MAG: DinB family protein [Candidatus Hydrogenedentes bacterium]|nr:DinB family protein [Candidatus Hydrogenedentota bacterium]